MRRAEEGLGALPPLVERCPLLVAAGRWAEARDLWAHRRDGMVGVQPALSLAAMAVLARARGERAEAWALVREGLPAGMESEPGTANYFAAVDLLGVGARLCLDAGDPAAARAWLAAHDRWLAWAGPESVWGRAAGRLAWAEYQRAVGDAAAADEHARGALAEASEPRQPLALLAAHHLLGELATEAGRHAEATAHLDQALALAEACAAPYERGLTLLALAELRAATGDRDEARALLDEAHAILTPLGARPALARAEALLNAESGVRNTE